MLYLTFQPGRPLVAIPDFRSSWIGILPYLQEFPIFVNRSLVSPRPFVGQSQQAMCHHWANRDRCLFLVISRKYPLQDIYRLPSLPTSRQALARGKRVLKNGDTASFGLQIPPQSLIREPSSPPKSNHPIAEPPPKKQLPDSRFALISRLHPDGGSLEPP